MSSEIMPHKMGPNENVKYLSWGDCDAPNWLDIDCVTMYCVAVCRVPHQTYIGFDLDFINNYKESQL